MEHLAHIPKDGEQMKTVTPLYISSNQLKWKVSGANWPKIFNDNIKFYQICKIHTSSILSYL
jgi:hypothetical protein